MEIALGILFSTVVVLYPVIRHLIPAVLLCVSGLFVNLLQAICFVCIRPISETSYTRLNGVVKELDWRVLLGIVHCCAGVTILECIEQDSGEEHKLAMFNARNDPDTLLELVISQWSGFFGSLLVVIKISARYIPMQVIEWSMWISEYVFSRSCVHDARKLKLDLKDFSEPFWLSFVLKRTGFTQGDLIPAQRLFVPGKVLSSNSKDLVYAVRRAYSAVPAILLITVAVSKTSPAPTLESVIKGGSTVVHVYIERHVTKIWPESDDAVEKLCTELLAAKNALLDGHLAEHSFGDKGLQALAWPLKSYLVVIFPIVLWAITFDFVCCSTLFVFSAALFTGRMLALFGLGVLSMMQCLIRAAIANITWSDHLKPICEWLIESTLDFLETLP